ncbi:AAA family ATPase [Bradyrhizobium genosp. L]|uniref:adenylate/guanylate cyclase domain-containing protein n=1 Tax=Bradyrhizobium genosp. L TaxID=83637 RepID=UPI0018A25E00|nr:adenylate/guanylate cyclase domain-containing protein [Bradyrhizobium genosp. L]QPF83482.1 AAA family ATPase [Bradyrhizobium genosp. L]
MQCERCGHANRAGNDYCEDCGAALGLKCDSCQHVNGPSSRFCGRCGTPLGGAGGARADQPSQRLLRSLSTKGGERKSLTLLFADIRNSTNLIDSLGDPELGMRRLEPVLDLMKEAVHRYDGIVNKIQGDGVMALFGAPPRPHEDHAVRGCLAALAMQDSIARLADPGMQIRVGLHTGEVVVQTVENTIYQTYDAAGANVHIANRMEQMAEEGAILITRDTYAGARQFVEVMPLGMQAIRGIATPVEVFRLTGLLSAPASDIFRSGRRLTAMVDRTEQTAALEYELSRAVGGDGRVVGMVGDAGIGKSRLCFEFAENCRRRGIRVYEARVLAHGRATPFQPVLELLRDYFGIQAKEPIDTSRRRVIDRFAEMGLSNQDLLVLLEFLGLADPDHPAPKLDPRALKLQLLELVRTLVRARPGDMSTVILIEDLHWIDAASEEFVEALVDAIVGTATLLLVNFRPGFSAAFMQRSNYRQIAIPPLAWSESNELLREHFGRHPSLALLSSNVIERAQGNPFFIEELANSVVERGNVEGERGNYRLRHGIDAVPLPATVQAVVAARIDHLEDVAKGVLETAAVIGRLVAMSVLRPVAALPNDDLLEAISQLRQAELLYDLPPYDKGLLAFRHPLIQEVAYATQLRSRLTTLHATVAKAIESFDWGRLDEFAGLLAYHYEAAGQPLEAVAHLQRAARWIGKTNSAEALKSWKKVRALLQDQPASEYVDRLRAMSSGQILNFGWREGMSAEEVKPYAEEAIKYARTADRMNEPILLGAYGRILAATAAADDYVNLVQDAVKLTSDTGDVGRFATVNAMLSQAFFLSGRLGEALDAGQVALATIAEQGGFDNNVTLGLNPNQILGFDVEHWIKCLSTRILVRLGRFDEAEQRIAEVLRAEPERFAAVVQFIPHFAMVEMAWRRSRPELAKPHAARIAELAEQSGTPYLRVAAVASAGLASAAAGDFRVAAPQLREAIDFARSARAGLEFEARMLADLTEALYLAADFDAALQSADEALTVARRRTDRVAELHATVLRGLIVCALGNTSHDELDALVSAAQNLLDVSGAAYFEPQLDQLRLHLERRR